MLSCSTSFRNSAGDVGRRIEIEPEAVPAHVEGDLAVDPLRVRGRRGDKQDQEGQRRPDTRDRVRIHRLTFRTKVIFEISVARLTRPRDTADTVVRGVDTAAIGRWSRRRSANEKVNQNRDRVTDIDALVGVDITRAHAGGRVAASEEKEERL